MQDFLNIPNLILLIYYEYNSSCLASVFAACLFLTQKQTPKYHITTPICKTLDTQPVTPEPREYHTLWRNAMTVSTYNQGQTERYND